MRDFMPHQDLELATRYRTQDSEGKSSAGAFTNSPALCISSLAYSCRIITDILVFASCGPVGLLDHRVVTPRYLNYPAVFQQQSV
jgi:hypothetical protein